MAQSAERSIRARSVSRARRQVYPDVDFVDQLRFRLAGTRVCSFFCREIKGEVFSDAFGDTSRKAVEELLTIATARAFRPRPHPRARRAGADVPPYWLGAQEVTSLELVTLRHVGPEVKSCLVLRFKSLADGKGPRHGFTVDSGGRETPPAHRLTPH